MKLSAFCDSLNYLVLSQDGRESDIRVRLPVGKYCIIPSTYLTDQEGDFILRVHIEQFGPEEEDDSDSDTLIETKALLDQTGTSHFDERSLRSEPKYGLRSEGRATPIYGSTTGRGNQLYGRTGGRATPLYGSRLQLAHVNDHMSARSGRSGRSRNH